MVLSDSVGLFFESFPDSALVVDTNYNVDLINDSACKIHGISQEKTVGKKCFHLYGESVPCLNCPLPEVVEGGRSIEKELFRENQKAWHLLTSFPISTHNGEVLVGIISKDITSTKTAEQILIDFNYKIKKFIDRMPIACILWDKEFRVSMWNPAAEEIFGYSEKEVIGKHPYEIIVPPDMIPETDSVKHKLEKGSDRSHRAGENITKDGQRIYCSWLNTPIQDSEGEVISVLSMAQDVTMERRMQNETLRSAQLASIGELAASVAHEINNPINGVINYCQLLLNDRQKLESRQIEILERTIKEGDRVASIVKGLLNFAREPSESMVPCDVRGIVEESIELLRPAIRKNDIEISMNGHGCNPVIRCNPQQIEQVVINIIKNAIDALREVSQENKKIIICCRREENENKNEFILAIENNGPAIPLHLQEKIFEPFMTTKENGAGTGLGLGISLEIMRRHGGTIRVRSEKEKPVEMALVFPL